jgi:hypothetical protein
MPGVVLLRTENCQVVNADDHQDGDVPSLDMDSTGRVAAITCPAKKESHATIELYEPRLQQKRSIRPLGGRPAISAFLPTD